MVKINKTDPLFWYLLMNWTGIGKFLGYKGTNSIRIGHLENKPNCRNKEALEELRDFMNKWIEKYK